MSPNAPKNLRRAEGPACCGNCLMYKSLDDYKDLIRQFGPASPLVSSYGYNEEYLIKDGICEVSGDPPVFMNQVCDNYFAKQ